MVVMGGVGVRIPMHVQDLHATISLQHYWREFPGLLISLFTYGAKEEEGGLRLKNYQQVKHLKVEWLLKISAL
jgi:hypothetical protein